MIQVENPISVGDCPAACIAAIPQAQLLFGSARYAVLHMCERYSPSKRMFLVNNRPKETFEDPIWESDQRPGIGLYGYYGIATWPLLRSNRDSECLAMTNHLNLQIKETGSTEPSLG